MNLKLSVIIPTLGKSPHLRGLLERLQRQRLEFPIEVLVVANIPQQPLRNLVRSMGTNSQAHFEYHETGKLGVNFARNKGLERARGDIILFLDDDVILDSDLFLQAHVEKHREFPDVAAIGGPYELVGRITKYDSVYHEIAHEWLSHHTLATPETTQLLGGNFSLKKSLVEKFSWRFDEEIIFGGAETGLCLRIARAGCRLVLLKDLAVAHSPQLSRMSFLRKAYMQGTGAKWRSENIPRPTRTFVNEFRPEFRYDDRELQRVKNLYKFMFACGWSGAPRKFGPFAIAGFMFQELKPLQMIRRQFRILYVNVRSAWLNGSRENRPAIPPRTVP